MNDAESGHPPSSFRLAPREVPIGGVSKAALLRRLHAAGVQLNEAAQTLFDDARFAPTSTATSVSVRSESVAGLGFREGATFAEIRARSADLGLSLCPLELGPHLRLEDLAQAEGSMGRSEMRHCAPPGALTVLSPPLDDDDETPKGFYLRRIDGTLWLRGYRSWPGHVWSPSDELVFLGGPETTAPPF